MSNQRYSPEFRDEAVRQILEGGHSTSDVAARLGVSANSLYKWVKAVQPWRHGSDNAAPAGFRSSCPQQSTSFHAL